MTQDPFAQVRLNRNKEYQSMPEQNQESQPQKQEDPFEGARIKKAEGFSGLYETGRHAARIGSRIAETIGGIPGDVGSLVESGLIYGLEKLGKKFTPKQKEEIKSFRKYPTSAELKEKSQRLSKGFTAPQSEAEELGDEYAETVASLLGPMKFKKALGVALSSNLAKQGLKQLGFGEGSQEAGKLGTMFLSSIYNPRGALKYADSQYKLSNKLSKGFSVEGKQAENNITNLVNELKKGITTTEKSSVIKPAEELLKKFNNGKIAVEDLTAAKRDINSIIGEPGTLKGAKKLLNNLGKEVDNAIKPFEKISPEFTKAYRPANEIFGAVMQGQKAANFISKTLGSKSFLHALIGEAVLGHPEMLLPTIGAAGGAYATAKTYDFFTRLAKSKELQKYYTGALTAAMKEDLPSLRIYSEKIDDELEKSHR